MKKEIIQKIAEKLDDMITVTTEQNEGKNYNVIKIPLGMDTITFAFSDNADVDKIAEHTLKELIKGYINSK